MKNIKSKRGRSMNNNQNFIGDVNPNSLSNNMSVGNTLPINKWVIH